MNDNNFARREFLRNVAVGLAGASVVNSAPVTATGFPHVAETDINAMALGYVEAAAEMHLGREVAFKKGSACGTCGLFQITATSSEYSSCAAFPGRTVNANGWCRAFSTKA